MQTASHASRSGAPAGIRPPVRAACLALLIAGTPAIAVAQDAASLGATVDGLLAAGRQLSPSLRAAALETAATIAKAEGADALDDPALVDNYQYYRDPGVFSGHAIMVTQAFPLWGKRDLRKQAALADVEAARGREQAAQNELDERIKVAFARYYVAVRALAVDREVIALTESTRRAAAARYGAGRGDQPAVLQALGEETAARTDVARLEGDRDTARAQLNALVARGAEAPLAEPLRLRSLPASGVTVTTLLERAQGNSPTLAASSAEIDAARMRSKLADKAWFPDVTFGVGPLIQTNNRPPGVAATIGVNIPLSWGREASQQKEAIARLGAAQQRYDAALLEIQATLGEALARLKAARQTGDLLDREALPQARAAQKSIAAGYGQGRGDLAAAIDAEHRVHDLELKLLQAQLDGQMALAAIERLIGGDL
jgi:cobalt-zinc-cadmium efflux system outer membrane protein